MKTSKNDLFRHFSQIVPFFRNLPRRGPSNRRNRVFPTFSQNPLDLTFFAPSPEIRVRSWRGSPTDFQKSCFFSKKTSKFPSTRALILTKIRRKKTGVLGHFWGKSAEGVETQLGTTSSNAHFSFSENLEKRPTRGDVNF